MENQNPYSLKEECGVVAAISRSGSDVSQKIYCALTALQHRGQDSCGMATLSGQNITLHRDMGLVTEVFRKKDMQNLEGHLCVGHVRYPTIGAGGPQDAQPFLQKSSRGEIALAHNGNIANYGLRRDALEKKGHVFSSTCDADLILAEFVESLKQTDDCFEAVSLCMDELDGSYSVCAITQKGELIVFRDPNAIRPLCWGDDGDTIMFASESPALDINKIPLKGDVAAGEALIITKQGTKKKIVSKKTSKRHCAFEYVYFSRPDSVEEKRLVYDVRMEMGRKLAKASPAEADIVVAVPDTARPAALGFSEVSGIPITEGLIKNRYMGRTFIMPSQKDRMEAVRLKLNAIKKLVADKDIILIDDSIVRGTTSGPIIRLLKEAGAKKIHLRIACPPVVSPCFYGVDLPTFEELIAANKSIEQIRQKIGAESLAYLSIEDLVASIAKKKEELCLGCLNGEYPTQMGKKLAELIKRKGSNEDIRIWEEKVL